MGTESNLASPGSAGPDLNSIYRCPRSGKPLHQCDGGWAVDGGSAVYPVREGVTDFHLHPPPDPDDERAIDEMTRTAREKGWRQAIETCRPHQLAYVTDRSRAIFLDLLRLDPKGTALEIGSGLGQFLMCLAPRVGRVHGLELSPAQARFALERCRQEGLANVEIASGGDDLLLPFADDSFDTVVLNHVFEWVRLPIDQGGAAAAQKLLLQQVHRVLKPGGEFFLATKNRFALRYVMGGRDENARDMRFGNALPRWLTRTLAARRTGGLGLLHSHGALAKLLRSAGFAELKSYWATPSTRYPKWYVPTDAASVRAAFKQDGFENSEYRSTKLVMPLIPAGFVRYITPGLAFVSRKAGPAR